MKKLTLLLGGVILSATVMAQKPTDAAPAPMSLEGGIGLQGGGGGTNLIYTVPSIRFRYFVLENLAIRANVQLGNSKSEITIYENVDFTGGTGSVKTIDNNWAAGIGAEYHFKGTERLSPYAGLEVRFGGGAAREEGDNTSDLITNGYTSGDSYTTETKYGTFGLGLVAGTDFYFAENFYFGLEVGLGWTSRNDKEGSFDVTAAGVNVSGVSSGTLKSSSMTTNATGLFRLGWRF